MCTFRVGSPVLVRKQVPSTPMKSPRSTSLNSSITSVANFLGVDVDLDPAGGIAQVHEMALAHVAVGGDAAGGAEAGAFREFLADLGDRAGGFISAAKGVRATRLERLQFFAPLRYETVFVVHLWLRTV